VLQTITSLGLLFDYGQTISISNPQLNEDYLMNNYIDQANTLFHAVENKSTVSIDDIRNLCLSGTNDQLRQEQSRVLLQCDDAEFSAYTTLMKLTQFISKYEPKQLHLIKMRVNRLVDCQLKNSKKSCPISFFSDVNANGTEYHMDNVYFTVMNETEQLEFASKVSKSA